jgi:iron complex outermembrane receptor protein
LGVALGSAGHGWASLTTAFQTPTTTELINAPPAAGEPCCPGGFNTDLEPQRAVGVEAGWRRGGSPAIEVVAYRTTVTDAPVPFQVESAPGREFYRSAGEVRHRGVEVTAALVRGPWTARLAYALGDFVFVDDGLPDADFEGNRLPGAPLHRVEADVSAAVGQGLVLQAEAEHAAGMYADDANDASVPAHTLLDLRASWESRIGETLVRPWMAVRNATDARHIGSVVVNGFGGRYYEPAPGRHVEAGLTMAVGGW